jgi:HK97 family phage portal protein
MKSMAQPRIGKLQASVRRWLGVPISLTDAEFWPEWGGTRSASGVDVSVTSAMQLDAVWACVRLISETIATLPLNIFERARNGAKLASNHRLQFVVHSQPNDKTTASVFFESVVAAMLLRGNARCEKLMNGRLVIGLAFLDPDRLTITCNADGFKEYHYANKRGVHRIIPRDRIWNVPGFSLDGEEGVSVIKYAVNVFGAAMAAEKASSNTFSNGLLQTIYYKMSTFLKPAQRVDFKTNLADAIHKGQSPLLEGGMDAGTLGIKPSDAQLLESRGFSVAAICRWFRVPPWMVGHTEKSTSWGTGIEQQMLGFLTFTLSPWLKRIEQAINKDLLLPEEKGRFYAKFSVEGLLRGDSAARAAFYGAMVDHGIFTRDYCRQLEELEPLGGNAAVLTVQSAMTTLDSLGQVQDSEMQAIRARARAFLGIEDQRSTEETT